MAQRHTSHVAENHWLEIQHEKNISAKCPVQTDPLQLHTEYLTHVGI